MGGSFREHAGAGGSSHAFPLCGGGQVDCNAAHTQGVNHATKYTFSAILINLLGIH